LADVVAEHAGLLDVVVVPLLALAVLLQDVELVRDLRGREEVAGVRVFRDEAECLLLAHAADHDPRVRPRDALRRAQRTLEDEPLALEASLVAVPHLQAETDGVLEPVEALGNGRKRDAETLCLVFVPSSANTEHPTSAGQDVE